MECAEPAPVEAVPVEAQRSTLKALAKALEIPEEEVFAAYRGKAQAELSKRAQRVVGFYNEMSPTAQRHFELIGEALWRESKRTSKGADEEVPPVITHKFPVAKSTEKKKRA